jgi:hypothetical protein
MDTGFEFADFYDDVVGRAGGEQTTAEDVVRVRRGIRVVLERWEAQSFNTWRIRMLSVAATGTSRWVALPACVDDVLHVLRAEGAGELTRYDPARYLRISDKDQTGSPGGYYLGREECPKLYLHPIGEPGRIDRLEVWHVERPEAFNVVTTGIDDVPGRWLEALIIAVAHDLARKRPGPGGVYNEQLIARLDGERIAAEDIARRADRDRARYRYRVAY